MALSTFVKINEITNLSDARYCSGMYVDLLGFDLSKKSSKFLSPQQFSEITGWLSGVEFVGEFHGESLNEITETLAEYEGIQWVEHSNLEVLKALQSKGFKIILKFDISGIKSLKKEWIEELSKHELILHITSKNSPLSTQERSLIKTLSQSSKVILGSGISPESVRELLTELSLQGIALNGGEEIKPGLKDFDELADILEQLEVED